MTKQIDETMSQDQAFTSEDTKDNTFVFDDVQETESTESHTETSETESDSATTEDKKVTVSSDEDEQKVPYSRFKKILDERDQTQSVLEKLEDRLKELESNRNEKVSTSDVEIPEEWVALYGNSEVSKRAFLVQLQREEKIQEKAVATAIERLRKEQDENVQRLSENEKVIDDSLVQLSETIGRKLTPKQEEEILSIVDEFSPVDGQGKYVSLFPFEKAYEIYTLRTGATTKVTQKQRLAVADLSGNTSDGDADSTTSTFERGWDNWRKAL